MATASERIRAARDETNRETLYRIVREIQAVADNDAISPTPYDHLYRAIGALNEAAKFALDMRERDGLVSLREEV